MLCNTCSGAGSIAVERPQYRWKNIHYTSDGYPAWPNTGALVVRERFPTGRTITYLERCQDCNGRGTALDIHHNPDCGFCQGTGECNAWDGDEYTVERCACVNPVGVA